MTSMDHVTAVVAHYDERAATYDDSVMHRALAAAIAAFVGEAGPRPGPVVDVATGTGLVLSALASEWAGPLVGVDLSLGMLAVARDRVPDAVLARADAAALPVRDGAVGLLTCVTGLHLFADTGGVAEEWARAVRPGGSVATATFTGAATASPDPGPGFARNHAPYRTPERLAATFGASFEVRRVAAWQHDADGAADQLLLCELVRKP